MVEFSARCRREAAQQSCLRLNSDLCLYCGFKITSFHRYIFWIRLSDDNSYREFSLGWDRAYFVPRKINYAGIKPFPSPPLIHYLGQLQLTRNIAILTPHKCARFKPQISYTKFYQLNQLAPTMSNSSLTQISFK